MATPHLINTTLANFEADVLVNSNERPVLVDFWADWCGPCKSIAPILEQLAAEYDGALLVVKVDTDAEQALAQQFGIRSLPTMMIFRDGEAVQCRIPLDAVLDAGLGQRGIEDLGLLGRVGSIALGSTHVDRCGDIWCQQVRAVGIIGDQSAAVE